jgi:hypothetical protein
VATNKVKRELVVKIPLDANTTELVAWLESSASRFNLTIEQFVIMCLGEYWEKNWGKKFTGPWQEFTVVSRKKLGMLESQY